MDTSRVRLLPTGASIMALKPPFSSLYHCSELSGPEAFPWCHSLHGLSYPWVSGSNTVDALLGDALSWQRLGLATSWLGDALSWRRLVLVTPSLGDALFWQRPLFATPCFSDAFSWRRLMRSICRLPSLGPLSGPTIC